jgi:hypothetical protein
MPSNLLREGCFDPFRLCGIYEVLVTVLGLVNEHSIRTEDMKLEVILGLRLWKKILGVGKARSLYSLPFLVP